MAKAIEQEVKPAESEQPEKKKRKPRTPQPPPVMPELDKLKLTDEAKVQLNGVLKSTSVLLEVAGQSQAVPPTIMREIRRALNYSFTQKIKSLKPSPEEKKKARLLKQIAKAQSQLKALGIEV